MIYKSVLMAVVLLASPQGAGLALAQDRAKPPELQEFGRMVELQASAMRAQALTPQQGGKSAAVSEQNGRTKQERNILERALDNLRDQFKAFTDGAKNLPGTPGGAGGQAM